MDVILRFIWHCNCCSLRTLSIVISEAKSHNFTAMDRFDFRGQNESERVRKRCGDTCYLHKHKRRSHKLVQAICTLYHL